MTRIAKIASLIAASLLITSCDNDADVASRNLKTDAANFNIPRRVIFYNGITDKYMLEIQGLCSFQAGNKTLEVICKVDRGYKKHVLGLSDNVTYFIEQLDPKIVSTSFYKVVFKPSVIIPDIELR